MDISASVRIEDGVMSVRNRAKFGELVKQAKDGDYTLTLERQHARISDAQRSYYWAVIVERLSPVLKLSPKMTHETLKAQFLPIDKAQRGENGTIVNGLVIGGSLMKLNKLETIDYFDRICDHAAEHWKTYIQPPDQNWREQAEHETAYEDARDTMFREKGAA